MAKQPRKAPCYIDRWDAQNGQELEIIDHGYCVELCNNVTGESIRFTPEDATRIYAGLERWIASKNQLVTNNL